MMSTVHTSTKAMYGILLIGCIAAKGLSLPIVPMLSKTIKCSENGLFAHADDVTKFYMCISGTAHVYACPNGMVYDSLLLCTDFSLGSGDEGFGDVSSDVMGSGGEGSGDPGSGDEGLQENVLTHVQPKIVEPDAIEPEITESDQVIPNAVESGRVEPEVVESNDAQQNTEVTTGEESINGSEVEHHQLVLNSASTSEDSDDMMTTGI